ncbi:hypothetical protein SAMD00019534_052230 [Acytostelium subglobosum LB1]|uniref:hypothetical protein n=1 Tax=Acytostelium subglobosum LB1 TaxID=1410327 RepID=UPI000644C3E7|nr:hypothetical protein SAMD00019534_052230 [Acytostelium subglobosum LB1]GAM22048.1 hypothetical protein SAMD00019534_052230 [Acytostelium subglobosum LB1]|eukprot:XP_012755148.1 hypothetical protein SAMD00019534_052230 [Acytostelium subglobosum LB1]
MAQSNTVNRRWLLASRPHGAPVLDNFKYETVPIPEPADGELLLRTIYLSLDPYMRGRMNAAESYAAPLQIGDVIVGGTVSVVVKSNHPNYAVGDTVVGYLGWQDYAISNGKFMEKLKGPILNHQSLALGALGMPGLTAYFGLIDIGNPKPGETVVVSAATGAVGSLVGQIAKIKGCYVVGIAGGPEKCRYAVETLGFDKCIDHKDDNMAQLLKEACPKGIDVYFENVGGKVFNAVLDLVNTGARIPICGLISVYNATSYPVGPDRISAYNGKILSKRMRVQGFISTMDYGHRYKEFADAMGQWVFEGKITYREDVTDGLENAPQTLIGLLEGKNFGKVIIKVADK